MNLYRLTIYDVEVSPGRELYAIEFVTAETVPPPWPLQWPQEGQAAIVRLLRALYVSSPGWVDQRIAYSLTDLGDIELLGKINDPQIKAAVRNARRNPEG